MASTNRTVATMKLNHLAILTIALVIATAYGQNETSGRTLSATTNDQPHESENQEDDSVRKQLLELFPQADSDKDGKLSEQEYKAVLNRALKRFPQLDRDGDGELSVAELEAMLRIAASRKKQQNGKSQKKPSRGRKAANKPAPQHANVKYGDHERHIFDLWLADSKKPTALAIYIHGGGFTSGSKEKLKEKELTQLLQAGISVAAINYRYRTIEPIPAAHHDARQALQFIRSKAADWNIDKDRVAVFGGSAGAQISMWLAFSDDMANPKSENPVERESTRVTCVASAGGQPSMEFEYWKNHLETFGVQHSREEFDSRLKANSPEEADKIAQSVSALRLLSDNDPPIFMSYGSRPNKKPPTQPRQLKGFILHHVQFGFDLEKKADEVGVENHLKYPGSKAKYDSTTSFLIDKLNAK